MWCCVWCAILRVVLSVVLIVVLCGGVILRVGVAVLRVLLRALFHTTTNMGVKFHYCSVSLGQKLNSCCVAKMNCVA